MSQVLRFASLSVRKGISGRQSSTSYNYGVMYFVWFLRGILEISCLSDVFNSQFHRYRGVYLLGSLLARPLSS